MKELIQESLSSVDREFRPNELAYLALTTKIENPLRDRWAFMLHRKANASLTVAREWRRTDIAVLENEIPRALIELKAMYTFDAALDQENVSGFCDAMEEDQEKAQLLSTRETDIYTALLATHPHSAVQKAHERVIKYRPGINSALRRYGGSDAVANAAVEAVNRRLAEKNIIAFGCLDGGRAFEIDTQVLYWLIKVK